MQEKREKPPFAIEEIDSMSAGEAAGFIIDHVDQDHLRMTTHPVSNQRPMTIWIPDAAPPMSEFHHIGTEGEGPCLADYRKGARVVWRMLYGEAKPAPKPIDDMAQGECFLAAEKLGARIGTTLITGNHIGVYKRYGFTAQCCPDEFGSREAALRNAVYHLAMRVGRYNPTTGTITEATDD